MVVLVQVSVCTLAAMSVRIKAQMPVKEVTLSEIISAIRYGLNHEQLINESLQREEAKRCANGAIVVNTGARTGRSPKDKFIVKDEKTALSVDWGPVNQSLSVDVFNCLWHKAEAYLSEVGGFGQVLRVGEALASTQVVQVQTEYAWHALFVRNLFIREVPEGREVDWQMINVPGLLLEGERDGVHSEGVVAIDFSQQKILICGIGYAGEMKKSMFSVLNYLLPEQSILPMHCAANVGDSGDSALFFGLSGTGKTTLSADDGRLLVGDDEHGWSHEGIFNFEGGCYAKCIDLHPDKEPVIWQAIREGAVMENVVVDDQSLPDFSDARYTQNTRVGYPLEHIPKRQINRLASHPKAVIFLTCDLYGVLPPVAQLDHNQAAYYFLSGYTALVGSTELGSGSGIRTTFSTCFGAPFFPRPAQVYADLLRKRLQETGAQVFLVNTGWTGGSYAQGGERFAIPTTRSIVRAIVDGCLEQVSWQVYPGFGFAIPEAIEGVDPALLNPKKTWTDVKAFATARAELVALFQDNFKRFDVDESIRQAGPREA